METKRRNRGGKRGTGGRNEKKNNEGEKANETKERIPRSFCLLRFLSRRKMKLLLYQSPFPFPRSSFSLRPGNEHPSLARSFLPFSVCYLFSLPVFLSIHPPLLLLLPTDLFALANVRTRSRVSRQVHKAENQAHLLLSLLLSFSFLHTSPPTARIPKIPSEIADGIFLLLVLSYLSPVGITVPLVLSTDIPPLPPPGRQIKFLEERRKGHLPFFRPSGNLKPVPLY